MGLEAPQRKLAVTQDDAGHDVEVVRQAAGESADRFPLPGLNQLFVEHTLFGDVKESAFGMRCDW
jgi:hypothetical protein